jgi:uncharacterized membrane protein
MSSFSIDPSSCSADWQTFCETRRRRLESRELLVESSNASPSSRRDVRLEAVFACTPARAWSLITDFEALPKLVHGLERVEVLSRNGSAARVEFSMKLPFPVGRLSWINQVDITEREDFYVASWTLDGGDLQANEGRILVVRYPAKDVATYARYEVHVATRSRLPERAQHLATCWLLPKIVGKLRRVAEA